MQEQPGSPKLKLRLEEIAAAHNLGSRHEEGGPTEIQPCIREGPTHTFRHLYCVNGMERSVILSEFRAQLTMRLPTSTYRFQFNYGFTLKEASTLIDYLSDSGLAIATRRR
jgi:hypothetical protein